MECPIRLMEFEAAEAPPAGRGKILTSGRGGESNLIKRSALSAYLEFDPLFKFKTLQRIPTPTGPETEHLVAHTLPYHHEGGNKNDRFAD